MGKSVQFFKGAWGGVGTGRSWKSLRERGGDKGREEERREEALGGVIVFKTSYSI